MLEHPRARSRVGRRRSTPLRRGIQDNFARHCGVQAPADSMKDSKQGELIEEESRWEESQILTRNIAKLILKIIRHDFKGRRVRKETVQEINSERVIGRAGGIEIGGSIHSPRSILATILHCWA